MGQPHRGTKVDAEAAHGGGRKPGVRGRGSGRGVAPHLVCGDCADDGGGGGVADGGEDLEAEGLPERPGRRVCFESKCKTCFARKFIINHHSDVLI